MSGQAAIAERPRVMVRTTMKFRGQSATSVDSSFFSVAHAVKFAGDYMTGLAAKEHEHVEWIRFELPPASSTSKSKAPTRKPARKKR